MRPVWHHRDGPAGHHPVRRRPPGLPGEGPRRGAGASALRSEARIPAVPGRIARRGALPLRSSFGRQRSTRPCHASPVALGLISDLHGNRVGLAAVVSVGVAAVVDGWLVLGDVVAIGPEPVATLEMVCNLADVVITAGNTERYVLTKDRPPPLREDVIAQSDLFDVLVEVEASFSWTRGALAACGWLGAISDWPLEVRSTLPDGTRVLGVHAAPGRDDGPGITPHREEADLAAALAGSHADVVFAGHTHQPTDRVVGGMRAVNLGSVSNPIVDDLRARDRKSTRLNSSH